MKHHAYTKFLPLAKGRGRSLPFMYVCTHACLYLCRYVCACMYVCMSRSGGIVGIGIELERNMG